MTNWVLVYSVTLPAAPAYRGSWERHWGEFTSDEMTPEQQASNALAVIAQDGNCIVLSGALWAPEGQEELSDHWYTDVTLGLNPGVYPLGTVIEPSIWAWIIAGLAGLFGFSWLGKGSDGGIFGGISGILEMGMMLLMMVMIMPMMQSAQPRQRED